MECRSEQERYEERALTHDVLMTPEQIALAALIDRLEPPTDDEE